MKLANRTAVITGANQGLGLAIAEAYVREGASIAICARDEDKLDAAKKHLEKLRVLASQKVIAQVTDVSKETDVIRFAYTVLNSLEKVDILINNAGVYGPKGPTESVESEEWVHTINCNLMSVFYMTKAFMPHFKKNNYGKIINLSGGGATAPLPHISSYAASKAAVVRLTETWALEVQENHIYINAVAPGALNTRLLDEVLSAGPDAVGPFFYNKALEQQASGGTPLEKGANLCVFLGSAESDGVSGKLISAVWDPWEDFPTLKSDFQESDIYTLRRIVPVERGKEWGK